MQQQLLHKNDSVALNNLHCMACGEKSLRLIVHKDYGNLVQGLVYCKDINCAWEEVLKVYKTYIS